MELRELRAFVTAARELHFTRAAARLYMTPSTMSDLIRKLEQELGTPLFTRTTRRVTLTDAGADLLSRAEEILGLTAEATEAVRSMAAREAATVRLGITPPAAFTIAPHLLRNLRASLPELTVDVRRLWLHDLTSALLSGAVDVAVTCGDLGVDSPDVDTVEIGSERLLVGLRPDHPLAAQATIDLEQLRDQRLGLHAANLFPAWRAAQTSILAAAGLAPPIAEINEPDLTARCWSLQPELKWIMLIGSLLTGHDTTVVRPAPNHAVVFTMSWHRRSVTQPAVQRFVECNRRADPPAGWLPPRGRDHDEASAETPTRA